jgi:hypothetical protein
VITPSWHVGHLDAVLDDPEKPGGAVERRGFGQMRRRWIKAPRDIAFRYTRRAVELHRQFFELLAPWFVRTLHRETSRDFTLLRVEFTHARNTDLREVHRLLRCPVDFTQGVDSWALPQRVMDLPIVSGDSRLLKILTVHADDLPAERHSVTSVPVTTMSISRLPQLEHTSRSRQSSTERVRTV